jgi:hypothetical protein
VGAVRTSRPAIAIAVRGTNLDQLVSGLPESLRDAVRGTGVRKNRWCVRGDRRWMRTVVGATALLLAAARGHNKRPHLPRLDGHGGDADAQLPWN